MAPQFQVWPLCWRDQVQRCPLRSFSGGYPLYVGRLALSPRPRILGLDGSEAASVWCRQRRGAVITGLAAALAGSLPKIAAFSSPYPMPDRADRNRTRTGLTPCIWPWAKVDPASTVIFQRRFPVRSAIRTLGGYCQAMSATVTRQHGAQPVRGKSGALPRSQSAPILLQSTTSFSWLIRAEFAALEHKARTRIHDLFVIAAVHGRRPDPSVEIIANAPPTQRPTIRTPISAPEISAHCQTQTFQLSSLRFGLTFDNIAGPRALTTPPGVSNRPFSRLDRIALRQEPARMMAAFQRSNGGGTQIKGR